MRAPASKSINLTENFYNELLGAPPAITPTSAPASPNSMQRSRSENLAVGTQHPQSPIKTQFAGQKQRQAGPRSPIGGDSEYGLPEEDETVSRRAQAPHRTHTPGHLASKSTDKRTGSVESADARSRSQSHSQGMKSPDVRSRATSAASSTAQGNKENDSGLRQPDGGRTPTLASSSSTVTLSGIANSNRTSDNRPVPIRTTSAIANKPSSASICTQASSTAASPAKATSTSSAPRTSKPEPSPSKHSSQNKSSATSEYTAFPPPPQCPPSPSLDVPAAPASGMYWSKAPSSGAPHPALRAHTTTLIGSTIFIFGGCDSSTCFNMLYTFDCDSFHWSRPLCTGTPPLALRAMTCTAVGKRLVVFGGGDGPAYYSDVWVLDTVNYRWSKPAVVGGGEAPSKRRAHTACLWRNGVYIFGGGDGVRALNDIWRLDVSELASNKVSWKLISASSGAKDEVAPPVPSKSSKRHGKPAPDPNLKPKPRGYHTANIVGSKLIVFGGSDGDSCFSDVWLFDITTNLWSAVSTPSLPPLNPPLGGKDDKSENSKADMAKTSGAPRLSHTSTLVGSYLFIIGGHDGVSYSSSVLCLNLVTMTWDRRKVYGHTPAGRGYHGSVLCDGRLFCIGGFDGVEVFGDIWILELGGCSYYSQISCFSIEV